jgi:hypothetical protein
MSQLNYVFGINKKIAHRIRSKEMRGFEAHIGHPYLRSAGQEGYIIDYIAALFAQHCPVLPKQIRAYV